MSSTVTTPPLWSPLCKWDPINLQQTATRNELCFPLWLWDVNVVMAGIHHWLPDQKTSLIQIKIMLIRFMTPWFGAPRIFAAWLVWAIYTCKFSLCCAIQKKSQDNWQRNYTKIMWQATKRLQKNSKIPCQVEYSFCSSSDKGSGVNIMTMWQATNKSEVK